jgi:hypothetical protein
MARAVDDALSPDNVDLPKGMKIVQRRLGNELSIRVTIQDGDSNQIETLISTLDEFVSHIHASIQALQRAELRGEGKE